MKNTIQKAVIFVLLISLALAFAGCIDDGATEGGKTIKILLYGSDQALVCSKEITTEETYLFGVLENQKDEIGITLVTSDSAYGKSVDEVAYNNVNYVNDWTNGPWILFFISSDDVLYADPSWSVELGNVTYYGAANTIDAIVVAEGFTYVIYIQAV